ncbi:hypothetical protein AV903_11820 [Erwinia tracheiphila]|uniref:Uncharacterized protein n=1 Tax=Erwinia tracheiphila TaxID=65700 RepID=A0A345CT09_9GAMM|nr:hypothetical protein AV903_11820 [Erwinia tracheiphila]
MERTSAAQQTSSRRRRATVPLADAVTVLPEVVVPAVIDGEQEFGGTRDIHDAEYKAVLRPCKASERRSRDARPVKALRSGAGSPEHQTTDATDAGVQIIPACSDDTGRH